MKNLVEMHGGLVEAASDGEGLGSVFTVRLPLALASPQPEPPTDTLEMVPSRFANLLDGLLVLVLDDELDAREVVQRLLEDAGAKVKTAASAHEAVATLEGGFMPDIIVSDIGMPDQDGYDFMERVRSMDGAGGDGPGGGAHRPGTRRRPQACLDGRLPDTPGQARRSRRARGHGGEPDRAHRTHRAFDRVAGDRRPIVSGPASSSVGPFSPRLIRLLNNTPPLSTSANGLERRVHRHSDRTGRVVAPITRRACHVLAGGIIPVTLRILGRAVAAWWNDNAMRLGASLSYYTLFAIGPILLVAVAVAGTLFGAEAVRGEIVGQIDGLVGTEGGKAVQALLQGATRRDENVLVATIGGSRSFSPRAGPFSSCRPR